MRLLPPSILYAFHSVYRQIRTMMYREFEPVVQVETYLGMVAYKTWREPQVYPSGIPLLSSLGTNGNTSTGIASQPCPDDGICTSAARAGLTRGQKSNFHDPKFQRPRIY